MKKILIVLLLMISGCQSAPSASYNQQLAEWMGQTQWALFRKWGQPDRQFFIDDDTYVLTYYKSWLKPFDGIRKPYAKTFDYDAFPEMKYGSAQTPTEYYCQTNFTLRYGIVIDYSFNGDDCI